MPGGRYPIESCTDVENAVRDLGRTPPAEREAVRHHIVRRATALGCPLPENWKVRPT